MGPDNSTMSPKDDSARLMVGFKVLKLLASMHISPRPVVYCECKLPLEVLGRVADHVEHSYDLLNFSLTSKSVGRMLMPARFRTVELKSTKRCMGQLKFLIAHPHIARYIRSLSLSPNYLKIYHSPKSLQNEIEVAQAVELLAPNLHSLEKFIWDGLGMPADSLWLTLRNCCPRLKDIGSQAGCETLDPDSNMFAFDDLLGFSLKSHVRRKDLSTAEETLPQAMWDMLLKRSPRLESLTLGYSSHTAPATWQRGRRFDVSPLFDATFPNLHTLVLQRTWRPRSADIEAERRVKIRAASFFLRHHPSLKHIDLLYSDYCPLLPDMSPLTFVALDFWNSRFWLRSAGTLTQLSLCNSAMDLNEFLSLKSVLGRLYSLTSFAVWVELVPSPDTGMLLEIDPLNAFSSILEWRPQLKHLTFLCSNDHKCTFFWKDLIPLLTKARLTSLDVCKMEKSKDMMNFAAAPKFYLACPTLEKIVMRSYMHEVLHEGVFCVSKGEKIGEKMQPVTLYGSGNACGMMAGFFQWKAAIHLKSARRWTGIGSPISTDTQFTLNPLLKFLS
ncbi:hypothetical protein C8J56DRAFT_931645 [Mycena floridula]|nr:hypothetical protein C8J56DRAFT_931645 [Mycena floridula]